MRTATLKAVCVAVGLWAAGASGAADGPKRDKQIEAVLDKFMGCKYEFDEKLGMYKVTWKDKAGRAGAAWWFVPGSAATSKAPVGASAFILLEALDAGHDAKAVAELLAKKHRVKAVPMPIAGSTMQGLAIPFEFKAVPTAEELKKSAEDGAAKVAEAGQQSAKLGKLFDEASRLEKLVDDLKVKADSLPGEIKIVERQLEVWKNDHRTMPTATLATLIARYTTELAGLKRDAGRVKTEVGQAERELKKVNAEIEKILK